ncbi:MAG: hypothetical protein DMF27_11080 [Verrucomicrobia bacterium]|nr:MAG: hypothetical protein DMF27_11080 [Verrucomicrobiota bacterium]
MSKYRSETQEMSYNFNQETRNRGQVSPFFWFLGFQIPDPDLNRRAQHAELIHISEFFSQETFGECTAVVSPTAADTAATTAPQI